MDVSKNKNVVDYVLYCDTDSVIGDTIINTKNGKEKISDFYDRCSDKNFIYNDMYNKDFVKKCVDEYAKSYDNDNVIFDKIKYVMKHKIHKKMFKITCGKDSVTATEDHSVIIDRKGELIDITPDKIQKTDKIIKIHNQVSKTNDFTIECLGYKEIYVYDIETENTHNFFANNILVHNSNYILIDGFCRDHFGDEWWESKSNDEKIDIIDKLSDYINDYINKETFDEVQMVTYDSTVEDFKIGFEKEKIGISGLFVKKKKYAIRALWVEGERKEKISVTGLDIIRSDSSEAVRSRLKDVMNMILRDAPDSEITEKVNKYKKELRKVYPEEIAANIGANNLKKYIVNGTSVKGTPWHIKGVANYQRLLNELDLKGKYEEITEGVKCKVVYLKKNSYGMETMSFLRWPEEFNKLIEPDMNIMIDKFFINKIEMLLNPMNKTDMLLNKSSKKAVGLFFK